MKINATKIRLIMAQKSLTMIALAGLSGVSRQSLSTILTRGTCAPINAGKIARGLGVSVEEIIEKGE